jgi:endonuclease/exonuclease/phosphatase family metal-dependent hydrolase
MTTDAMRILTLNVLAPAHHGWDRRRGALVAGIRALAPDVVALQEVVDVPDLLGPGWHEVWHSRRGEGGDGAALASRWPIGEVHEVDGRTTPRSRDLPWSGTVVAEVRAPEPIGPFLAVHHKPLYRLDGERERELQAVAAARLVETVAPEPDRHVVLLGDFDARPDSASVRFWTGRQSLEGMSVCYHDAWESAHGDDPGHTFTPENPLVQVGGFHLVRGRRIDYVMVRGRPEGPTLQVRSCRRALVDPVDGVQASDHYGVLADLVVPERRSGTQGELARVHRRVAG